MKTMKTNDWEKNCNENEPSDLSIINSKPSATIRFVCCEKERRLALPWMRTDFKDTHMSYMVRNHVIFF